MKHNQTLVIGAGIAGLVAAYQLHKEGADVVVLESSSRVGGRMITDSWSGYLIDAGAQFLSSAYSILSGLIAEFGLESEYVQTSHLVGVVRDGKIRKFRYDNPFSMLSGGLLSIREWVPFVLGNLKLWKKTRGIPLNDYSAWKDFDNESVESWSNLYFGRAVTDYFMEPLLEAFYFQSPANTSRALAVAINAFGAYGAKTMTLVRGIGKLPELIAGSLDIRLKTTVDEIRESGNQILVRSGTETYMADRVILAVPAPVARRIHTYPEERERALLATHYSSTVNVAIGLDHRLPPKTGLGDVYGVWIPGREREAIAAFTIESAKHIHRAGAGELMHVMLAGDAGRVMISQQDERIIKAVISELETYVPGIADSVAFTKVYRWQNAEPESRIGRSKNIYEYRRSINENSRVILAGDHTSMPFTEGAAESGLWAAQTVQSMA